MLKDLLQGLLQFVDCWCRGAGLFVNPTNTEFIVPSKKGQMGQIQQPPAWRSVVGENSSVKYMGVILDRNVSWKDQ